MKLIGVGDSVLDAYLNQKKLYPGGNSVNVAVLARRFGACEAAYIGILGDDAPGRHFRAAMIQEGVDVSRVRIVHGQTAYTKIWIDETGDRHFVGGSGADTAQRMTALSLNENDFVMIAQYDLAHTSVHSFLGVQLAAIARRAPLSMDFSDGYTSRNMAQICPLLRFAFFSGGDKTTGQVEALARYALDCGAQTVVVTRGERGSYVLEQGGAHTQPIVSACVTDALGAGDAYIAAFLVSYDETKGDIAESARRASAFAAKCCEYHGAFGKPFDAADML